MKWIGQHIYDLVARFRDDVYLEGISTSTETDMLVVDSNNKISKRAIDAIDIDVSDFMTNGVDNRILTATSADAMNGERNFTFDGSILNLTGVMDISPASDASAAALTIDNDDTDQVALDIIAANVGGDVINITADSVTTGNVIDISCDALTTGSALKIEDDSATTGVGGVRNIVDIYQKNTAATVAQALSVKSDGGQIGVLIDKNASGAAAQNVQALKIDFDRTVPGSGTSIHNDIGAQIDVTSASLGDSNPVGIDVNVTADIEGTSIIRGLDIDVVGDTGGTSQTNYGIDVSASGADANWGLYASSTHGIYNTNPTASSATQGGIISLASNDGAATGDDHRLGVVEFIGTENAYAGVVGASIEAFADAAWSDTVQDGRLVFSTGDGDMSASGSATLNTVLTLDSNKLATFTGAVTVTGAITGNLTGNASGTAATVTGSTQSAITSTANLVTVGTIGTGVWQGTAVASAYLDADTMHYSAQRQLTSHTYKADQDTTKTYVSLADADSEATTTTSVDLPLVAGVSGKLLKIFLRSNKNLNSHTLTWRLETQAGVNFATGPSVVGTQSGAGCQNSTMTTYDFTGVDSNVVNAGEMVYISLQSDTDFGGNVIYYITCLWEWDLS